MLSFGLKNTTKRKLSTESIPSNLQESSLEHESKKNKVNGSFVIPLLSKELTEATLGVAHSTGTV
jgi:hypothetical protein